jgi:hypothetical protein
MDLWNWADVGLTAVDLILLALGLGFGLAALRSWLRSRSV